MGVPTLASSSVPQEKGEIEESRKIASPTKSSKKKTPHSAVKTNLPTSPAKKTGPDLETKSPSESEKKTSADSQQKASSNSERNEESSASSANNSSSAADTSASQTKSTYTESHPTSLETGQAAPTSTAPAPVSITTAPQAESKIKTNEAAKRERVTKHESVLPLPGSLDATPVVNCNSPEIVIQPGVLLSTFPGHGKAHPNAHLDYKLSGRFDIFFHHVTDASKTGTGRTLYLGLLVQNASERTIFLRIMNAVSYATKPDAVFINLPTVSDNKKGNVYAGPGDRVTLDMLRGHAQKGWKHIINLAPGETKVLYCLPLKVKDLSHPLNGRSGIVQIYADGQVHLASLAAFALETKSGERKPKLGDWVEILTERPLVSPRDKTPTPPGAKGQLVYGRVSGVAAGATWHGEAINDQNNKRLNLVPGQSISYPLSTVFGGTLGTNQVQAAQMLARYPDTAYRANGNYGVMYNLTLPLYNDSEKENTIALTVQTPLKDWNKSESLQFFKDPPEHVFFRGTVKFEWNDRDKKYHEQFVHLVEKQGQSLEPLVSLSLHPHEQQDMHFSFFYPPDCTPPQVLTISSE